MEKEKRLELYDWAIKKWGTEAQREMVFEELGELITVLAQDRRGRVTKEEILTELADVHIMVEQLALMLDFEGFEAEKDRKLSRLKDRLGNGI